MSTPAPTPAQVTVALEALRADAAVWTDDAGKLRAARGAVAALQLPPSAFSFGGQQLAAAYAALLARACMLLEQGAANFTSIASALRASADAYEADENAHLHQLQAAGR